MFNPYFHANEFPFISQRPTDSFRFGRISRGDVDKFGSSQLRIYETMIAPSAKEGWIVGWNEQAERKFGRLPESYIQTFREGEKTQQEFYRHCDAVIMTTETFENLPRVGFEAMASGALLVVDNRGGWRLQVENGVTGWLCENHQEFVCKASRTAFELKERELMQRAARVKLEREWGLATAMHSWEQVFKAWDSI